MGMFKQPDIKGDYAFTFCCSHCGTEKYVGCGEKVKDDFKASIFKNEKLLVLDCKKCNDTMVHQYMRYINL